jgi:FkbM family methyltransferase
VTPPAPVQATGSRWQRGWQAIVGEHRWPTELSRAWDRLCLRLGRRHKAISAGSLRFRVRRLTADEYFVRDVVVDQEYVPNGYAITETDLVLDIGANIGAFAVYAATRARRGRVISLEPVRDSYRLLVHNVAVNRCDNVTTRRAALVARQGPTRVYLSPYGSGGHSVLPDLALQNLHFEQVEGLTLADLLQEYQLPRCDFLKLDCEGAEFEVAQGTPPAVWQQVAKVVVEYHTFPDRDKLQQSRQLAERLIELGFTVDRYTDVVGTNWGMIYARRSNTPGA